MDILHSKNLTALPLFYKMRYNNNLVKTGFHRKKLLKMKNNLKKKKYQIENLLNELELDILKETLLELRDEIKELKSIIEFSKPIDELIEERINFYFDKALKPLLKELESTPAKYEKKDLLNAIKEKEEFIKLVEKNRGNFDRKEKSKTKIFSINSRIKANKIEIKKLRREIKQTREDSELKQKLNGYLTENETLRIHRKTPLQGLSKDEITCLDDIEKDIKLYNQKEQEFITLCEEKKKEIAKIKTLLFKKTISEATSILDLYDQKKNLDEVYLCLSQSSNVETIKGKTKIIFSGTVFGPYDKIYASDCTSGDIFRDIQPLVIKTLEQGKDLIFISYGRNGELTKENGLLDSLTKYIYALNMFRDIRLQMFQSYLGNVSDMLQDSEPKLLLSHLNSRKLQKAHVFVSFVLKIKNFKNVMLGFCDIAEDADSSELEDAIKKRIIDREHETNTIIDSYLTARAKLVLYLHLYKFTEKALNFVKKNE